MTYTVNVLCTSDLGHYLTTIPMQDQRVPADMVFLHTTETSGTCYIRTDQLDGETNWKLRVTLPITQKLETHEELFTLDATLFAEKPQKDIYNFIGTFTKVRDITFCSELNITTC